MIETNVRVVIPGPGLYLNVRGMVVSGTDLHPDILERACSRLRIRHGIAAVPDPLEEGMLLTATTRPSPQITLQGHEWEIRAEDSGNQPNRIYACDMPDTVALLVERALQIRLARQPGLWSLHGPRIWYGEASFREAEGICAFRRYEVSAISIDDVGIGVMADVGTAFFSKNTLDYYFDTDLAGIEIDRRARAFRTLSGRREGQKGTLVYDNGSSKTTCYFEEAPSGLTCYNTGTLVVGGKSYESLYHYYRDRYPALEVQKDAQAVRVSFRGLSRPTPVAANLLRLRVMNSDLPSQLSSVDKIRPDGRHALLTRFWKSLEPQPLGRVAPGLRHGFWRPSDRKVFRFTPPAVDFGDSETIGSPSNLNAGGVRSYYRDRLNSMERGRCYSFPPASPRTIHVAHPRHLEEAAVQVGVDVVDKLEKWTGRRFQARFVGYDTVVEACGLLRDDEESLALFVLDGEPASYYEASFHLPGWRVKRITDSTLETQLGHLNMGVWDRRRRIKSLEAGKRRWDSFVTLNALDVLQLLDAVPYRTTNLGAYEAQLAVDVGFDRKFYAVSLLVGRDSGKAPEFGVYTEVYHKSDSKKETINKVLLKDAILDICERAMFNATHPLDSLLIIRDGRVQAQEILGIESAIDAMRGRSVLNESSRVDIVGLHKTSLKKMRMWSNTTEKVANVLEGTAVSLDSDTVVLCSTGAATLTQGTADPVTLVGVGHHTNLCDAAYSTFASAQLNWSSPGVAQRLPLPLKRADDELNARLSQEIRRIR